jgi:hypothetical protein
MYRRSCRIITALRQARSTRRDSHTGVGKGQLSSVMMPHRLVYSHRYFGEACCLNLLGLSCHSSITSLKDSRASHFRTERSQNEDVRTLQRLQEGSWRSAQKKVRKKNKVKIFLFSNALSEGSQTSPACPSDKSRIKTKMPADHQWIDTEREKNQSTRRRICTSTTLSPKNVTRSSPSRPALKHALAVTINDPVPTSQFTICTSITKIIWLWYLITGCCEHVTNT